MIAAAAIRAAKALLKKCLALLDPPPALKVWAWGELRRRMGRNVTAKPGRYKVSNTPFQQEPQEAFTDPEVQTTVLYWGKRLGKTEMINNLHGSVIEQNPRNILHVMPTLDSAKKWSKQFFSPMMKSTPVLRDKIKEARSRDANNTILAKEYPGGTIAAIGSNSPSGFRQVQAPVVTCDEVDAMEDGPEGDPVTLAFGRAENYPDSVQVVSSTATRLFREVKDGDEKAQTSGSRIHDWWLKSDQRRWFVPCGCGKWHVLAWAGIKWPKTADGIHMTNEAYYETPCCGAKWDDYSRLKAIMAGEWRPTAPFRGIRGYHLNGINTTFPPKKGYKTKLHQMAQEFLDAYTSGEAARIAWKNTFLCEPHIEDAEKIDAAPLYDRQEDYTPETLPAGVCVIALVMDVQDDRLEYEFIGMGLHEETWGIESGKIQSDPELDPAWDQARMQLARRFKRVDGVELRVDCCAIDHRHKGSRVRKFVKTCGHPNCYAVYGAGAKTAQQLLVTAHQNKHYRIKLFSVNTDLAKDTIFARLKIATPGPRYMHFPKAFGYERVSNGYFDQLTAEEMKITFKAGRPIRVYEKIRARNEALDIRVYHLAAMDILKPVMPLIFDALKKKALQGENVVPQDNKPTEYKLKATVADSKKEEAKKPAGKKRFSFRGQRF